MPAAVILVRNLIYLFHKIINILMMKRATFTEVALVMLHDLFSLLTFLLPIKLIVIIFGLERSGFFIEGFHVNAEQLFWFSGGVLLFCFFNISRINMGIYKAVSNYLNVHWDPKVWFLNW